MTRDEEIDFVYLQRRAYRLGVFLGMHRDWTPRYPDQGPFYIRTQKKKVSVTLVGESESLAKYITLDEARECLDEYEKRNGHV